MCRTGGPSSVRRRIPGRPGLFGVAATNWNTRTCPQIQPPWKKPGRQPGQRSGLSSPQSKLLPQFSSSARTRSYGTTIETVASNRAAMFSAFADSTRRRKLVLPEEQAQAASHASRRPSWDRESQ